MAATKSNGINRISEIGKGHICKCTTVIHNLFFFNGVCFMVFNATFNTISVISWRSISLVEETGVLGENHRPAVSRWQTLSHNVVSSTPHHEQF